jgi:hypothetical protein
MQAQVNIVMSIPMELDDKYFNSEITNGSTWYNINYEYEKEVNLMLQEKINELAEKCNAIPGSAEWTDIWSLKDGTEVGW